MLQDLAAIGLCRSVITRTAGRCGRICYFASADRASGTAPRA